MFMKNKNIVTTSWGFQPSKNKGTLSHSKVLVVFIKKCIETLYKLQEQWNDKW